MAMTKQKSKNDCNILNTLDELVPQEHLVRKLDNCIDFTFIEELVKDLYSDFGRPSIPPVVLFKLIFINIIFGINSMRRTCEECKVNIAYRWFLGLSMYDDIPNYSTWSQNYKRRYKDSDVFDKIFEKILDQAIEYGFIEPETVFGDGTHQKANANKNKHKDVEVEINPNDLRIDVFRASGNGGQCVNTTDSAVRITHIPTGEVVSCQDEKSQLKNKEKAMKALKARLYDKALAEQHDDIAAERKSQVGTGDRSERIRTYNFPQGRVSDHRINLTLYKLESFLDGDLDEMIDALITEDQTKKMSAI